jgi:lysozyme family protein
MIYTAAPSTDHEIVAMILAHEGGIYTNHPADRGGPTKWGITIPVLSAFRGWDATVFDIQTLTRDEAAEIYTLKFIRPFDGLALPVRSNVIDMGVNAGTYRAAILLQQAMGVDVDGKVGPKTRSATFARDWNSIYVGFRLAFYEDLIRANASQGAFRRGWRSRALSFYDAPRLRVPRNMDDVTPVFGFTGKALLLEDFGKAA